MFSRKFLTFLDLRHLVERTFLTANVFLDERLTTKIPKKWDNKLVQQTFCAMGVRPCSDVNDILVYRVFIDDCAS